MQNKITRVPGTGASLVLAPPPCALLPSTSAEGISVLLWMFPGATASLLPHVPNKSLRTWVSGWLLPSPYANHKALTSRLELNTQWSWVWEQTKIPETKIFCNECMLRTPLFKDLELKIVFFQLKIMCFCLWVHLKYLFFRLEFWLFEWQNAPQRSFSLTALTKF